MENEELYNEIIDCFAWWEIEEEEKQELKKDIEENNFKWLVDTLTWFKDDYKETENIKDLEIITEIERRLSLRYEWEIRENLHIEYEDCEELWDDWKNDIYKTLAKYYDLLQQKGYSYCLESDWREEKDYMQECNKKLEKVVNKNGLIIYKMIKNN